MIFRGLLQWFGLSHGSPRGKRQGPNGDQRRTRPRLEELEPRTLLTDFALGDLVGRTLLTGVHFEQSVTDTFRFGLTDTAFLDVQIADRNSSALDRVMVGAEDSSIEPFAAFIGPNSPPSSSTGALHIVVPSGIEDWVASAANFFGNATIYDLALAADRAPGELFSGSLDFSAFGREVLGTLATVTPTTVNDFIGYLQTSNHAAKDLIDIYAFTVPTFGAVDIKLSGLENDQAGGSVAADIQLFRDIDGDGRLEPGEALDTKSASVGHAATISRQLNAGFYFVVVSRLQPTASTVLGGSNYELQVTYSVADNAGSTPATARDLTAVVGTPTKTVTEYLSDNDTVDLYRFSVTGGGPYIFDATLTQPDDPGTLFEIELFQDKNNDGVLDSERLALGVQRFSADSTVGGTFYLRVIRVVGEGIYTLSLTITNLDRAGGTLPTATNIGNLFGQTHLDDFVSFVDSADIYKFTLTAPGTITASFGATALGTDADLQLIRNVNGNDTIEANEILDSSSKRSPAGESVTLVDAAAADYFVRVARIAGSPAYHMTLAVDTAGSSPGDARTMGLSGASADTIEFVGPPDPSDFYQLNVPSPLQLNVFFSLFGDALTMIVGQDANGNGSVDPGEAFVTRSIARAEDVRQTVNLLKAGTYFVEVRSAGTVGTNYGIVFATAPLDFAGNTPETARDLGVLGATQTFKDFVGDGSIDRNARGDPVLGADDVDDYYRFTLGTSGPYIFVAQLTGLTGNADVQLFLDEHDNQSVEDDDPLASSSNTGTINDLIVRTLDTPGTYYLRVFRPGAGTTGSANYTLTMTAVSTDTAGNDLLAARVLRDLTTTTPLSASDFVGRIDPDDFYSFTILAPGILSVSVGGSSGVQPLTFEVILDKDSDFVGDQILATKIGGGFSGVSLPSGGTYYFHVMSEGANANYSATLSLSNPPTGAFAVTATGAPNSAGERVQLGLEWTVPEGSWHLLKDLELRLSDLAGTLALIKFNEADNTLSLFNTDSGKYGPAKVIGSHAVLSNRFVTIYLGASTVEAAGPTSPTVTLTLDIEFKKVRAGRHIIIEAAGTDDLGHVQDFAIGGSLDVLDLQSFAEEKLPVRGLKRSRHSSAI